jgi:predicted Fe-Mo cluster-binding NifX family protein
MKICIPTDEDRGFESEASAHFGRAPLFVLADTTGSDLRVVRNPECHEHHGSCHHHDLLKAHHVDAVVCEGIGRRATSGLEEVGIDVLVPPARTVREIVDALRLGKARRLSPGDACAGGRRHRRRHHGGSCDHHGLERGSSRPAPRGGRR